MRERGKRKCIEFAAMLTRLQWKHLGRENNREIKILSNANVKRAGDKGRRKGEAKGEPEGRRSEKEWSVINLIKKLNARARRVVGK